MNSPFPVSSLWSSKRLTGWPAPKRILPGRMFMSLSLELLVGWGGVVAVFRCEPTRAVIPGWSEGPDLRGAIAPRGISRFRVRAKTRPGMTRFRASLLHRLRLTLGRRLRLLRRCRFGVVDRGIDIIDQLADA